MPTKPEKDAVTGVETTGHEWDGIKELNNPLPKWWLYVFYVTIVWSFGYWVLYPAIPLGKTYTMGILGYSQRVEVQNDMAMARAAQARHLDLIEKASVDEIRGNPDLLNFALAGGKTMFAENCAPCHGAGGAGAKGYPTLADDDWLWGGTAVDIEQTIKHGIRSGNDAETRASAMPKFGADGLLKADEINDAAEFVLALAGKPGDAAAAERGGKIFADNCVACHGEKGEGSADLGAPKLSDGIWLYGGDKKTIVETITNSRSGVMPAWATRLDAKTIKQLTVYVHGLGGGK